MTSDVPFELRLDGDRDVGDRFGSEEHVGFGLREREPARSAHPDADAQRRGARVAEAQRDGAGLTRERERERRRRLDRVLDRLQFPFHPMRAGRRRRRRRSRSICSVSSSSRHCGGRGSSAGSIVAVFSMWSRTTSMACTRFVRSTPAVGGNVTRTCSSLIRNGPVDPGTNESVWKSTSGCSSTKPSMTASTSGSGMPRSGVASMKLREFGSELHTHRHQVGEEVDGDLGGSSFVVAIGLEQLVDRIDHADRQLAAPVELAGEQQRRIGQVVADRGAPIAVEGEVEIERHDDQLHAEITQHRGSGRAEHLAGEPCDATGRRRRKRLPERVLPLAKLTRERLDLTGRHRRGRVELHVRERQHLVSAERRTEAGGQLGIVLERCRHDGRQRHREGCRDDFAELGELGDTRVRFDDVELRRAPGRGRGSRRRSKG